MLAASWVSAGETVSENLGLGFAEAEATPADPVAAVEGFRPPAEDGLVPNTGGSAGFRAGTAAAEPEDRRRADGAAVNGDEERAARG